MSDKDNPMMKRGWLAAIHIAKDRIGLTSEAYRALLGERYGVSSAKDLAPSQGLDLINHLKSLALRPLRRTKPCTFCLSRPPRDVIPGDVVYPVSPRQLATIRMLRDDIQWKTSGGFDRWLMRYFGIVEIKTSPEASRVIAALKGLWRSQHKCTCSLMRGNTGKAR